MIHIRLIDRFTGKQQPSDEHSTDLQAGSLMQVENTDLLDKLGVKYEILMDDAFKTKENHFNTKKDVDNSDK